MKVKLRGAFLGLILSGLACLSVQEASAVPVVSIQPPSASHTVGTSFDVSVSVASVVDLYAFQFDLTFDPSIISATGVFEGTFLPGGGTTFFLPGTIDNATGKVEFTSDSLLGALAGVDGDGVLATISFSAIGGGTSAISLTNVALLDSILGDIAAITGGSDITINRGAALPEPGTAILFCLAGAAASLVRRRARSSSK